MKPLPTTEPHSDYLHRHKALLSVTDGYANRFTVAQGVREPVEAFVREMREPLKKAAEEEFKISTS